MPNSTLRLGIFLLAWLVFGSCAQAQSAGLRRLKNSEVTPAISAAAVRLLRESRARPFGAEIPFTADGRTFVARVERHYHPPGGAARPWGWHKGISVFAPVGPVAPAPKLAPPTLRRGARGLAVSELQARLNAWGAQLRVDGIFGARTDAAVRVFQRSHQLQVDGLVGPQTRAALAKPLPRPSR